jgi:hypothetical protein
MPHINFVTVDKYNVPFPLLLPTLFLHTSTSKNLEGGVQAGMLRAGY